MEETEIFESLQQFYKSYGETILILLFFYFNNNNKLIHLKYQS